MSCCPLVWSWCLLLIQMSPISTVDTACAILSAFEACACNINRVFGHYWTAVTVYHGMQARLPASPHPGCHAGWLMSPARDYNQPERFQFTNENTCGRHCRDGLDSVPIVNFPPLIQLNPSCRLIKNAGKRHMKNAWPGQRIAPLRIPHNGAAFRAIFHERPAIRRAMIFILS